MKYFKINILSKTNSLDKKTVNEFFYKFLNRTVVKKDDDFVECKNKLDKFLSAVGYAWEGFGEYLYKYKVEMDSPYTILHKGLKIDPTPSLRILSITIKKEIFDYKFPEKHIYLDTEELAYKFQKFLSKIYPEFDVTISEVEAEEDLTLLSLENYCLTKIYTVDWFSDSNYEKYLSVKELKEEVSWDLVNFLTEHLNEISGLNTFDIECKLCDACIEETYGENPYHLYISHNNMYEV